MPRLNSYVTDMPFDDVGANIDGIEFGLFSGKAHLDQEGEIVGLQLDGWHPRTTAELPEKATTYFSVPRWDHIPFGFAELLARRLAAVIARDYAHIIKDNLDDWHVSRAEREWQPLAAAE